MKKHNEQYLCENIKGSPLMIYFFIVSFLFIYLKKIIVDKNISVI